MRAAFTPPGPLETPQETGIRQAEEDVSTREAAAREAAATPEAELDETVQAGAATPEAELDETVQAGAATPEAELDVTVPGKTAESEPPEEARGVRGATPATVALPPESREAAAPPVATDRRAVLGALALLLLVVVGLGFVIGSSAAGRRTARRSQPTTSNDGGRTRARVPGRVAAGRRPAGDPGPASCRTNWPWESAAGSSANALAAGTTDATGPALLPSTFLDRLASEPPKRDDAVQLGDLSAYRYAGLRPEGFDGRLTVYVSPTSAGVVTVACTATAADATAFLPDCEQVAGALELVEGKAFALGADEDYLAKLDKAIERAQQRARAGRREAAQGKEPGRPGEGRAVAQPGLRPRAPLARGDPVSPAVRGAAASSRRRSRGRRPPTRGWPAAAKRGNAGAYSAARNDVRKGEAALQDALRQVRAASWPRARASPAPSPGSSCRP